LSFEQSDPLDALLEPPKITPRASSSSTAATSSLVETTEINPDEGDRRDPDAGETPMQLVVPPVRTSRHKSTAATTSTHKQPIALTEGVQLRF